MAASIKQIAKLMGATQAARLPETGGGAFGAARVARLTAALRHRLTPSPGERIGRPSDPQWGHHPKVPMSQATLKRLRELARRASSPRRKVSPMQVAAQLLEEALSGGGEQ